jgi:hypothetical protein
VHDDSALAHNCIWPTCSALAAAAAALEGLKSLLLLLLLLLLLEVLPSARRHWPMVTAAHELLQPKTPAVAAVPAVAKGVAGPPLVLRVVAPALLTALLTPLPLALLSS